MSLARHVVYWAIIAALLGRDLGERLERMRPDDWPPAISARVHYMEVVAKAADSICLMPEGAAREQKLEALQREHRAFTIECGEKQVAVYLRQ